MSEHPVSAIPSARVRASRAGFLTVCLCMFALGIGFGAWLFHDVQWRPLLVPGGAGRQLPTISRKDLLGLLASAGIQTAPDMLPLVAATNKLCIAIRLPGSGLPIHYVAFPRRDILDIQDLARPGNGEAASGCLELLAGIIRDQGYRDYRVYTNGPDQQDVRYLHFHLVAFPHVTNGGLSARFRPGYPLPSPEAAGAGPRKAP